MALLAAPAVSFVGMSRFRFEGSSGRSHRNLSPPRRTPLQATRTKYRDARKARESFGHGGSPRKTRITRNFADPGNEVPTEHTEYTETKSGSEFRVLSVYSVGHTPISFVWFVFFVVLRGRGLDPGKHKSRPR